MSDTQEIKRLCEDGLPLTKIAKKIGVTAPTVKYHLKKMGMKAVNGKMNSGPKRHSLNHNAFDVLTPESLYWLGFLMADGCVSLNNKYIILTLQSRDINHLKKYKGFLGYGGPIFKNKLESCGIRFSSAHMKQKLISYGVIPLKGTLINSH